MAEIIGGEIEEILAHMLKNRISDEILIAALLLAFDQVHARGEVSGMSMMQKKPCESAQETILETLKPLAGVVTHR